MPSQIWHQTCIGELVGHGIESVFILYNGKAFLAQSISKGSLWIAGCNCCPFVCVELSQNETVAIDEPLPVKLEISKDCKLTCLSLASVLKACAKKEDLRKGSLLHANILSSGLHKDIYVGNTLISMYAKCGAFSKAQHVLRELPFRDVISWSALISGYVQRRRVRDAFNCYDQMLRDGVSPNAFTYSCILKACGIMQDVDKGIEIHEEIASQGLLGKDVVLGNALVDMYVKSGAFAKAQQVLDELSIRDVVSWSALIAGYAQCGQGMEALDCYEQMLNYGVSPDAFTYTCTLKACGITGASDRGKQLHDEVASLGLLAKNVAVGTAVIDMYVKCGVFEKAQLVLNELSIRNAASWNALISGYAQQGFGRKALDSFKVMQSEGVSPTAITYTSILKACGMTHELDRGKQVHDELVRQGFLLKDVRLGAALVDMYAKCGLLSKAAQVMDELPVRNIVCWNALILGYAEQGQANDALTCYEQMLCEGVSADVVTYNCIQRCVY